MQNQIRNYIRAGYPGIYLVSCEEARIEAEMKAIVQALDYRLFGWSVTEVLVDTSNGHTRSAQDPMELMSAVDELPENTGVLLKDFHQFLEDGNPVLVRKVKESLRTGKTKGKALVIVSLPLPCYICKGKDYMFEMDKCPDPTAYTSAA